MKAETPALPYTKEAYEALNKVFQKEGKMIWINPITNFMSIKDMPVREDNPEA